MDIETLPYRENVGVMLMNKVGNVFVGQRLDSDPASPAWQMPQGGIDPGETPRDAALRELEEETGVSRAMVDVIAEGSDWVAYDLPRELIPQLWGGKYRGQKQKWFLMRFLGADSDVNIVTEHPEFEKWQWMSPSDLVANIVPFKRAVYEAVLDQFEAHL